MKNTLLTFMLLLSCAAVFSQSTAFEYTSRQTPAIKKEQLYKASFISDIMPDFSRHFQVAFRERNLADQQLQLAYYAHGYYIEPAANYNDIMDYQLVTITSIANGKILTAESTGNRLSIAQKQILNSADPGSNINIKIKFKYKNQQFKYTENNCEIKEGDYTVTVIPAQEAEFPGGNKQLSVYINENIINKIPAHDRENIWPARVKFTVTEEGEVSGATIIMTSSEPYIDRLIIDAINKMPAWRPAKNILGIKVKEEFTIPFSKGC
jgi:hypothetical protein